MAQPGQALVMQAYRPEFNAGNSCKKPDAAAWNPSLQQDCKWRQENCPDAHRLASLEYSEKQKQERFCLKTRQDFWNLASDLHMLTVNTCILALMYTNHTLSCMCMCVHAHTLMHSHTKANNIILTIIFRCIIKIEGGFLGCAHVSVFMCGQAHMCVFICGTTGHCCMLFLRHHPPCLWRQGLSQVRNSLVRRGWMMA